MGNAYGLFFSSDLQATTFERSREFDVDRVTPGELHDIADRVRQRLDQESVLTFDFPERPGDPVDAVRIEVPGIDAQRLRDGLLADREAAERLFGGSVTLDGRLVLERCQHAARRRGRPAEVERPDRRDWFGEARSWCAGCKRDELLPGIQGASPRVRFRVGLRVAYCLERRRC